MTFVCRTVNVRAKGCLEYILYVHDVCTRINGMRGEECCGGFMTCLASQFLLQG